MLTSKKMKKNQKDEGERNEYSKWRGSEEREEERLSQKSKWEKE